MTTVQPLPPTLDGDGDMALHQAQPPGSCTEESLLGDHGASRWGRGPFSPAGADKGTGTLRTVPTPVRSHQTILEADQGKREEDTLPWPRSVGDTRPHPGQETSATSHSWPAPRASGIYRRSCFPTSLRPPGPPLLPHPPTPPRELGEAGGDRGRNH